MGPFMIQGLPFPSWNLEGENMPNSNHSNHLPLDYKSGTMPRLGGRAYLSTEGGGCLSPSPGEVHISESGVFYKAQHVRMW